MKTRYCISLILLAILTAGCKPVADTVAYFQYNNLKFHLVRTRMTITYGDGRINARSLMNAETYSGELQSGRVTVSYPDGCKEIAEETASSYDKAYGEILAKTGTNWSFDIHINLVRVDSPINGFKYEERLKKNRQMTFPLFVITPKKGNPYLDPRLATTIAHEMTEASMIAPKDRHKMVMSDLFAGPFCLPFGARWFRDGVSDYAADVYGCSTFDGIYRQPNPDYKQLQDMKTKLLEWSNCGDDTEYGAARALVQEIINRGGDDALPRAMVELANLHPPDGSAVRGAVLRASGIDVRQFLKDYHAPWLGLMVQNTKTERNGLYLSPENQVRVTKVLPDSPASRRGVMANDIIVSIGGTKLHSVVDYTQAVARTRVGEMTSVEIIRNGEPVQMKLKVTARPKDQ